MVEAITRRVSDEDHQSAMLQSNEGCTGSPSATDTGDFTSPQPSRANIQACDDSQFENKRNPRKPRSSDKFSDMTGDLRKPLTDEERREWKGWVELESDPILFSYILRSYGVRDVKVEEVFALDLLSELPKPVYGLIFLFKYRDDDAEEAEGLPKCPKDVWFANQTNDNACATVALLNIVMNTPQIELGDALSAFKKLTEKLRPAYRGQRLSCDDFIRGIHNSFARRMDILNADLAFSNEYEKWTQANKAAEKAAGSTKKKSLRGKSTRTSRFNTKASLKRIRDDGEAGYHFIAYVPVNDIVWRLDGLQRQPINVGETKGAWIDIARDNIQQRIAQYEDDGIEYSLMALCRSTLHTIQEDLAKNSISLSAVDCKLRELLPNRAGYKELDNLDTSIAFPESSGLPKEAIDQAIPGASTAQVLHGDSEPKLLLDLQENLCVRQSQLKAAYMRQVAEFEHENLVAEGRKHDYTSIIYDSIKYLASEKELKGIVLETQGK